MGNMFDLDDNLLKEDKKETKDYSELLKKANIFCMRELFDKALAIYNEILEEDMENEEAYIGLLKVHSAYFTKYDGDEIEKDIRIIERMFPDTVNEEYAKYCLERKKALASKKPEPKPEPKVEVKEEKKEEAKPAPKKPEQKKEEKKSASNFVFNKDIQKAMHHLDVGIAKKAIDITRPLINSGTNDIYAYFAFGYGNYLKNRFTDAKKYLELFLSHIDKSNPFYGDTNFSLGYSYSGLNGRVPDIQKAIDYYYKAYEDNKSPITFANVELLKETLSCPDLFKYTWGNGSCTYQGNKLIWKENVEYAKKLISNGKVYGYAIWALFDESLPEATRINYLLKYINDPKVNKKSRLYVKAWIEYYEIKDKKITLPPFVKEVYERKSSKRNYEERYLSLKRGL